ncbi:universal stress protein [Altericroceibacterium endophyticum]|nr:universal stress protein [Altericroceibacterium endophyticum]
MERFAAAVLVASDLSARDDRAVDRAIALGDEWGQPVNVVHVRKPSAPISEADVRQVLPVTDAEVNVLLPEGSVPETLIKTAREQDCGLIVTGVARFNQLGDYFLGTAVDDIIRHSFCPVLVVKKRPHHSYRDIVVATDFSAFSANALRTALAMFPEARIHLIHAFHLPFKAWLKDETHMAEAQHAADEKFTAFLDELGLGAEDLERIIRHNKPGSVEEVLIQFLAAQMPDLLVIGTHGASGFEELAIGTTTSAILGWAPVDTLVVPLLE